MTSESLKHETLNEDVESSVPKKLVAPDGGWGWVVCMASACTSFIVVGMTSTTGIFLIGLKRTFDDPVSKLSLVGALITGLSMLAAPLGSLLLVHFSHRTVMMLSGVLGSIGALVGAFSTSSDMMIVTYGLISGISIGMSYFSSNVITGLYFDKKRVLAIGINNCGGGLGMMVSGMLMEELLDYYGLKGTLLLIAGFLLNISVFGALCRPLKNCHKTINAASSMDQTNHNSSVMYWSTPSSKTEINGDLNRKEINLDISTDLEHTENLLESGSNVIKDDTLLKKLKSGEGTAIEICTKLLGIGQFKNINFLLLTICYVLLGCTMIMGTYIPPMCVWSFGMSVEKSATLITIHGLFVVIGELLIGVFVDLLHITSKTIFSFSLLALSVASIIMPHCYTFVYIIPLVCVFGFASGLVVSMRLVLTTEIAGLEHTTKAYSVLCFISGIAYFGAPPIFGVVFDSTQSFLAVFYGGACCTFIAFILFFFVVGRNRFLQKCSKNKEFVLSLFSLFFCCYLAASLFY